MKIFIMRHGEAANIKGNDSLRPLTGHGMREAEKMGSWLVSCEPKLQHIFVSPYLRAQQTSTKVFDALAKAKLLHGINLETIDFITPAGNASQVHDFIDGLIKVNEYLSAAGKDDDNVAILLISHMPFVSYLVAELTGSLNMPIFSTGSVAVIDYNIEEMQGKLVEMMSPAKMQH